MARRKNEESKYFCVAPPHRPEHYKLVCFLPPAAIVYTVHGYCSDYLFFIMSHCENCISPHDLSLRHVRCDHIHLFIIKPTLDLNSVVEVCWRLSAELIV